MGTATETIMNSVIELTEQRQLRSLADSLVSTIKQLIQVTDVAFVSVESKLNFPISLLPGGSRFSVEKFPECIRLCTERKRPVTAKVNGKYSVALPLMMNGAVVKVLWVQAIEPLTEQHQFLLGGLAKIYENFFNIVLDSETDSLTCLLNKKAFDSQVMMSFEQTVMDHKIVDNNKCFWLVIFDIDKFKKINDTYGHLYGDEVLLLVANAMNQVFDDGDLTFRFGGDEFVVLMAPREKEVANQMLNKFQDVVAEIKNEKLWKITCSIGAVGSVGLDNPTDLLVQADRALYYVKEHGRDQVAFFCDLVEKGELVNEQFDDDIELF